MSERNERHDAVVGQVLERPQRADRLLGRNDILNLNQVEDSKHLGVGELLCVDLEVIAEACNFEA